MNTIANLYHTARQHPINSNINAYSEAVNALLESKPLDYISNLEYIISSDIGLQTLPNFAEKYGIAIPLYDTFIEKFDTCIEKCKSRNVSSKAYEEWKNKFESFKQKHSNCFSMFEYYTDQIDSIDSYIETYYSSNNKGIQNSKNVTGMLKKFGEAAIPDVLLVSEKYDKVATIVESLIDKEKTPLYYEWMSMVIPEVSDDEAILKGIYESVVSRSASMIVFNAYAHNDHIFKESLLSDSEYQAEFTDSDIDAMRDLISINEQLLQECTDEAKSFSLYKGINKLYEHVAAYEEKFIKDLDDVFEESTWESNTMDKKTGKVPGYLANNHDYATWGEDDTSTKKKKDNDDKSLEDYERPSAKENKKDDPLDKIDTSGLGKPTSVADKLANETDKEMKQAINNYYYYTYNNSLNKTRDDHSIHKDSHDVRTTDDHSVGKMINSSKVSGKDPKDEEKEESAKPWELDDIFGSIENFNEGSTQNTSRSLNKVNYDGIINEILNNEYAKNIVDIVKKNLSKYHKLSKSIYFSPQYFYNYNLNLGTLNFESYKDSIEEFTSKEFLSEMDNFINDTNKDLSKLTLKGFKCEFNYSSSEWNKKIKEILKTYGKDRYWTFSNDLYISLTEESIKAFKSKKDLKEYKVNQYIVAFKNFLDYMKSPYPINESSPIRDIYEILDICRIIDIKDKEFYEKISKSINVEKFKNVKKFNFYCDDPKWNKVLDEKFLPCIYLENFKHNEDFVIYSQKTKKMHILVPEHLSIYDFLDAPFSSRLFGSLVYGNNFPISKMECKKIFISIMNSKLTESVIENFNEGNAQNTDRPLDDDDPPEIGSADADKPKSDHPVQDALHDIDRKMTSTQQNVKKTVQGIENTGRVFMKPFRRVKAWIDNMIANFKDKDENAIKEKIADPHARKNIFSAARAAVEVGALAKAGILLNPLFLAIAGFKAIGNKKKAQRIRNEMVGELKTEIEIVTEKIKDADRAGDTRAKYQLMRFRNELNKKLLRVGGYAKQAPLSNVI